MSYAIEPAATHSIDQMLGFDTDPYIQDWDIERADGSKLDEWLALAREASLNTQEKRAFFALIVASYDEFLDQNFGIEEHQATDNWISEQIQNHKGSFRDIIEYWKRYGSGEPGIGTVALVLAKYDGK